MRLAGKVALITGAATGIEEDVMGFGGAAAHLFAREGARVVVTDINDQLGERTASQIQRAGGVAAYGHLDVTSEKHWIEAMAKTVDAYGRLDILVNNAGVSIPDNLEQTTYEVWKAQMDLHAKGTFLGTKHAIPLMRRVGGGSIVNMSSVYALIGSSGFTAYHAAKGAIRLFTKSTAIQYAKDNIRANSVHPGYMWTPMTRGNFPTPESLEPSLNEIPLGRLGDANDVAYGVLYLASDESSYVTGAELVIDGGMTAH